MGEACGPTGGLQVELAGSGSLEGAEVVAERAVENAAFSGSEDEGHGVRALINFGCGFGEDPDAGIAGEAGVEFVSGFEIR